MSFHTTKSGCMISSIATQKEIVSFLNKFYPITKKAVIDFIKASREKKYIWNNLSLSGDDITIYMEKGKMFMGIKKQEV